MEPTKWLEDTEPEQGAVRCWTDSFRRVGAEEVDEHPNTVCLHPSENGWRVTADVGGEPVLDARYEDYGEAADTIMEVFALFMEGR